MRVKLNKTLVKVRKMTILKGLRRVY